MKISISALTKGATMLAVVLSLSLFTSCKKDEKDPEPEPTPAPPPPTNTQKLTGKNWKLTAATVDPPIFDGNANISDLYNSSWFPACSKDDLTKFDTDGKVTFDEGPTKCDQSDPQTTQGTWAWNTNETILSVTQNGETTSMNVLQNDGNTFKADYTENLGGTNYKFTYTFTKQ